ncbi:MAG TPA: hypothetical protein VL727_12760 [Puia sp.]|nr:hypothetical protein [Puia sp.]
MVVTTCCERWHTTKDHTGDANGYFMLINASYQPSDFYVQTVGNLCAGTTYLFSAWVMNMDVSTGALADISFTIESGAGAILGTSSVESCFISDAYQWQVSADGGVTWSDIPGATGSTFSLTAQPPGTALYRLNVAQAGNIDNLNCRVNSNVLTVTILKGTSFGIDPAAAAVCEGDSILLTASGGDGYQWSPPEGVASPNSAATWIKPLTTTAYSVAITNMSGCPAAGTETITLTVNPDPKISVSKSNDLDCATGSAQLYASGGIRYTWSPAGSLDHADVQSPVASPRATTTYYVQATSDNGCVAEDSIVVKVNASSAPGSYLLPNVFSPNNDGHNDCFGVKGWVGIIAGTELSTADRRIPIPMSIT